MKAGCTEGDWCPINADNFASKKVQNVYVLGDAKLTDAEIHGDITGVKEEGDGKK